MISAWKVVFINKADQADPEMTELVEIEMRELLTDYGFDGINTPVVCGSALLALQGDETSPLGAQSIRNLLAAVDKHIPTPERDVLSPFWVPVDNVFTVPGRGTVAVGTIKKGTIKKGDEAELHGHGTSLKTVRSCLTFSFLIQRDTNCSVFRL